MNIVLNHINIRLTTYYTISSNDLLHNSKEFSSFSGLYMYYNEACNRDPLFNRFTSIDPMAEKNGGSAYKAQVTRVPQTLINLINKAYVTGKK